MPLTLILMYVLLNGSGYRYVATSSPSWSDLTNDTTNVFLLFAINSIVFWIVCLVQVSGIGKRHVKG